MNNTSWLECKTIDIQGLVEHDQENCEPKCDWMLHGDFDFSGEWFVYSQNREQSMFFQVCRFDTETDSCQPTRRFLFEMTTPGYDFLLQPYKLRGDRLLAWQLTDECLQWSMFCCSTGSVFSGKEPKSEMTCFPVFVDSDSVAWATIIEERRIATVGLRDTSFNEVAKIQIPRSRKVFSDLAHVSCSRTAPDEVLVRYKVGRDRAWNVRFTISSREFGEWCKAHVTLCEPKPATTKQLGIHEQPPLFEWMGLQYLGTFTKPAFRFKSQRGQNTTICHEFGSKIQIDVKDLDSYSFYIDAEDPNTLFGLGVKKLIRVRLVQGVKPLALLTCQRLAEHWLSVLPDFRTAEMFSDCFATLLQNE